MSKSLGLAKFSSHLDSAGAMTDTTVISSIIDSAYVSARVGNLGVDSATVTGIVDSDYIIRGLAEATIDEELFVATASQTDFTLNRTVNNEETILVSLDGVVQPSNAYTMDSSVMSFASGLTVGTNVKVMHLGFLGNVADGSITLAKLDVALTTITEDLFSSVSGQTEYTLSKTPLATSSILVSIDGIIQPSSAYSLDSTIMTISPALDSGTDVRVVHLATVGAGKVYDSAAVQSQIDSAFPSAFDTRFALQDTHDSVAVQAQINSTAVTLTGDQTVAGIKTFSDSAQFNTHVHISGPLGGNGQDGIYDAALSLTASNQTTLSVMNDSDGFANLNLGSVDPLGDGSNKSNFWHISYRNLSSHSNKLQNFWYDSSGFAGPFTTLTTDGDFGIGVADPAAKLHVNGSFRQTGATVPFEWTVNPGASDYYKLNAVGYSDNLIVANSSGQVGLQTTTMLARLNVGANGSNDRNSINIGTNYPSDGTKTGIITWRDGANVVGQLDTSYDGNSVRMNIGSLYQTGYNTNDIMRIDPRHITMPNQPHAQAYLSGNQSFSGGVWTQVNMNATDSNIGSHYNTSTRRFTAPVAGKYLITYSINFTSASGTGGYLYSRIDVNGAVRKYVHGDRIQGASYDADRQLGGSLTVYLNANDYVTLAGYSTQGNSFNGSLNPHRTYCNFTLLG